MKFNRVIWFMISFFMILIAFQLVGCGSSGGGGGGDDDGAVEDTTVNRIILSADPSTLTVGQGETSDITAIALDADDNPVENAKLRFSVPETSGSRLNGSVVAFVETDAGGTATVNYTPPTITGSDTVTVAIDDITANTTITVIGPAVGGITLRADPTSIPADGIASALIYATVTAVGGGAIPDNTTVNFSILQGTGHGSISSTAETSNGVAVATLTSSTNAETVTVRAEASGIRADLSVSYTPGSINITIVPNSLLATGESTATVTAKVLDLNGLPAGGESVNFSVDQLNLGTITTTATTDVNGEAIGLFKTKLSGGTVTVNAQWAGTNVQGSDSIFIQPPPASINNSDGSPNPATISIKGSGGQTTSVITFDIKDSGGALVADGYRVDFEIDSGPGGKEFINPLFATTVDGKVSTILSSGTKPGPVSIVATYHNNTNITTTLSGITIKSGNPVGEEFGIFSEYLNVSGLSYANLEDIVSVNVGDIYGNNVPDNTAISFKTYNTGGLFTTLESLTSSGVASNTLISTGTNPSPVEGFLFVTAEANNGGRTTHVTAIEIGPDNSDYIYAATDGGGIYKSTNSGDSWSNTTRSSTTRAQNIIDPYVNDLAIDPDEPNTIYAATGYLGRGNIYRSLDGGATWNSNDTEEWDGLYWIDAEVLTIICDDGGSDYVWAGTQGRGLVVSTDGENFSGVASTFVGYGKTVTDIVKQPNTNGAGAVLYAGTSSGVYKSSNGGATWNSTGAFTGSNVTSLDHHPNPTLTTVYVGTQDAGVWASDNGGTSWSQYITGLGKGAGATTPVASVNNAGNGVMNEVTALSGALNETWTFTCTTEVPGGGVFAVTGSVSGDKADYVLAPSTFYTVTDMFTVSIESGTIDFEVGDSFTFTTIRDLGREIKDVVVDATNNKLYALTYFWGALEPHAIGNVYVADLDGDGLPGAWREATTGLPVFAEDRTLYPQHVMAVDENKALYIGGEGINFYKATGAGMATGSPAWNTSKNGMSNLIMTRMPILFTGECAMDVDTFIGGVPATPGVDEAFDFHILTMDGNGNPPIAGSTLVVKLKIGDKEKEIYSYTYADGYTGPGTFPDPNDITTYNPHIVSGLATVGYEYIFEFTPTCDTTIAPGCSGGFQKTTIPF